MSSKQHERIKLDTNEPRVIVVNMVLGKVKFAQNKETLKIIESQIVNNISRQGLSVKDIKLKYIDFEDSDKNCG